MRGKTFVLENCQTNAVQNQCFIFRSYSTVTFFSHRCVYVSDSFHISFSLVSLSLLGGEICIFLRLHELENAAFLNFVNDLQPVNELKAAMTNIFCSKCGSHDDFL